MARNFSCGTYYGICDLLIESLLEDIPDGATAQMYAATANYCDFNPNAQTKCINGSPTSGSVNYYWTVGATSIIALNSSSQQIVSTPKLKGVSPGSGYANVEAEAGSSIANGGGTPTVEPVCFAQLKYRSIADGEAVHTFWYVQDPTGTQYIVAGGPSVMFGTNGCGYLNAWVTSGIAPFSSTGIPADTAAIGTWWSTGTEPSNAACAGASTIVNYGRYWTQNSTTYEIYGPNSNTFAGQAGEEAGFFVAPWNMTGPPTAVGWP